LGDPLQYKASKADQLGLILAGALSLAAASNACAQDGVETGQAPASPEEAARATTPALAELVILGSNIQGGGPGASPVDIITAEEIQRRGLASVPELLATLPQNFAGVGALRPQSGAYEQVANYTNATGANLRGLGARATLTLIDGQRVAPTGAGTFFDASVVPMSALRRVEVLSDGASATYGSDAVAGVINYVLKAPGEAAESHVRVGAAKGGYQQYDISQSAGLEWAGGGLILAAEHLENTALEATDREFSRNAASPAALVARSKSSSLFASADQTVGRLRLSGSVLHSERRTVTAEINQFMDSRKSFSLFLARSDLRIGETWTATGALSLSRDKAGRDSMQLKSSRVLTSRQASDGWFATVKATGVLFEGPAGPVRAAFGLEGANSSYLYDDQGDLLADASADQVSGFGELLVPLARGGPIGELDASLALRASRYQGYGDVTNPKFGLVWRPSEDLRLRATWGTSFKAPALDEISPGGMSSFVSVQADPLAPSGFSKTLILTGSNPGGLEPERSTNWTIGFDLKAAAVPGLKLSATYFAYDYRDRIDRIATSVREMLFNRAIYGAYVVDNPSIAQVEELYAQSFWVSAGAGATTNPAEVERIADARLNNVARSKVRGADFELTYVRALGSGQANASVGGTYFFEYRNTPAPGGPSVSGSGVSFRPSDLRLRAAVGFDSGPWSANAAINLVGPYDDRLQGLPDRRVGAWAPLDLRLAYAFDHGDLTRGVTLALIVRNALDEPPPYVRDAFYGGPLGYDTTNADPVGRLVALDLTKRW
jgi:iron complex outermembrane recepter protein